MRNVMLGVGAIAVLGIGAALITFIAVCPCERTPGTVLSGEQIDTPITDWHFANDAPLCQIEVQADITWSVNLNCMSDAQGQLYLSCARCDGKYWSTAALARPDKGRIRIAGKIYPVVLRRVTAPAELDIAWAARAAKTGRGADQPRADHWWSFRLESRPPLAF